MQIRSTEAMGVKGAASGQGEADRAVEEGALERQAELSFREGKGAGWRRGRARETM